MKRMSELVSYLKTLQKWCPERTLLLIAGKDVAGDGGKPQVCLQIFTGQSDAPQ